MFFPTSDASQRIRLLLSLATSRNIILNYLPFRWELLLKKGDGSMFETFNSTKYYISNQIPKLFNNYKKCLKNNIHIA